MLLSLVVCAETARSADAVITVMDSAGVPIAGAVVWFDATDNASKAENSSADSAVIDQINRQFVPQLTVIRTGTEVEFPNSDSVSHHVYSFAQPNNFELPLYRGGESPRIRFDHPGVVILGCNIHDTMLGYIVVVDTADFAFTDQDGIARFSRSPAPDSEIQVWSSRLDATKPVVAERLDSSASLLSVRIPARLQPQAEVSAGSLAWEDY